MFILKHFGEDVSKKDYYQLYVVMPVVFKYFKGHKLTPTVKMKGFFAFNSEEECAFFHFYTIIVLFFQKCFICRVGKTYKLHEKTSLRPKNKHVVIFSSYSAMLLDSNDTR